MVTLPPKDATDGLHAVEAANFPQILDQCLASGIVAIGAARQITTLSPEAGRLLGMNPAEALGRPAEDLPAPLRDVLRRALEHESEGADAHIQIVRPDGASITLRVSCATLQNEQAQPIGAVAVLNNVTPARHLDENLRRMDRLASIGTLSASMAHEIKNALVAVKTFVDLLIKKNQDAALADIVGREMKRIDSIVSQMLRFGGPARPTFAVIHLHQVLDQSLNLVQHHLEGRKIKLTRAFRASPDTVRADTYQLEQAFINLFFNALDAMGANGELTVSTELVPPGGPENPVAPILRVTIQDTGMGIAPENLNRLFEPFYTTKPNGTGLGLPITRRIVQEHRGLISVASEPHQGTTFTLLLPSAAQQP